VKVSAGATSLVPGESTQLVASASTASGKVMSGAQFTWLSDAPAVATVDAAGRVTAVSPGTAAIGATAGTVRGAVTITVRPASTDPLTSIVDSIRLAWNMPAMGAAIVTLDEGLTAIAVAGTRRATGGAAVSTDDLWHLGSNTKAATSMLAAVAVSQNRIQWTTTVAQAFPELTNIRAEYREVTLRDLLSHQSGFPRDASPLAFASGTTAPAQRALAVTWAVQEPPGSARGTFSYSNLGYVVAAAMLERAFGTSFEAEMAARIYAPLGVTDAGWGPQAAAASTTQPVAHVWEPNGSWLAREAFDNPPVYNSSGRAHMSLTSWGRLLREVLRVEAGTSTVAPAAVARQTTSAAVTVNATTSYGHGWLISTRSWANGKVLYHDGSNGANHSLAFVAPMRNVAFLATTNGFDAPGGRSTKALDALIARLNAFHTTGR
jgi:CubicO group peptidase (beta-lactamase class C family)